MESKGYFKIPRSLTRSELWINLPPAYRDVFYVILDHTCFKSYEFDDHGYLVVLQPGQFCASIREIVNLCGKHADKNVVERSIAKFVQYGWVRKEVRHSRMILTISHSETYEFIKRASETLSETDLRQSRDSFETQRKNDNKENNEKEEQTHALAVVGCDVIISSENSSFEKTQSIIPSISSISHIKKLSSDEQKIGFGSEKNVMLTQQQFDDLLKEMTCEERDYWINQIRLEIGKQGEYRFNKKYDSHYHTIMSWKIKRSESSKSCLIKSQEKPSDGKIFKLEDIKQKKLEQDNKTFAQESVLKLPKREDIRIFLKDDALEITVVRKNTHNKFFKSNFSDFYFKNLLITFLREVRLI